MGFRIALALHIIQYTLFFSSSLPFISIHQALLNRTHNVSNILPVVGRSQAKRKIRPNALLQHLRTCFALSKIRGFVRS